MPAPDALDLHIVYFDRNRDGVFTRPEVARALEELGFSPLVSKALAVLLVAALPTVATARGTRHADSGAFARDGHFDEAAFEAWFGAADADHSDALSRWELLVSSAKLADGPVSLVASVAEFQVLYGLLAEDGGLHRAAVREFLNGDLMRKIIASRASVA